MKRINQIVTLLVAIAFLSGCEDGIDPITEVDPGQDMGGPVIVVEKPTEGFVVQDPNPVASLDIKFRAEDDIELASVVVKIDGSNIASYSNFLDYRIFLSELVFDNVTTGDHVFSVEATDLAGNTSISSVNFSKKAPYQPLFDGEILYMNFDGSFTNLIPIINATEVGSPKFTTDSKFGSNAYQGVLDSYLTYPAEGMLNEEISICFWYKMSEDPTKSGIITMAPYDDTAAPDNQNNINYGLRIFRDGAGGTDLRLLVGTGVANRNYNNTIETTTDYIFVTATVSATDCKVYFDGELKGEIPLLSPIDWAGTNLLSIGSGAPTFTFVGHYSDLNYIDELRIFNKSLTQEEILEVMNGE